MYIVVEGTFDILSSNGRSDAHPSNLVEHATYGTSAGGSTSSRACQPLVVTQVGRGAALGEVGFFLQGTARNATVRAVTRAYVLRLPTSYLLLPTSYLPAQGSASYPVG